MPSLITFDGLAQAKYRLLDDGRVRVRWVPVLGFGVRRYSTILTKADARHHWAKYGDRPCPF